MTENNEEHVEVFIPFPGFYESELSDMLDWGAECILEEDESLEYDSIGYNFEQATKEYLEWYQNALREEYDFSGEFLFKQLISPREYNFTTDQLLAEYTGPVEDLRMARWATLGLESLGQDVKEMFESRPGFASFYDDFVEGYKEKPLDVWDANELSVLLPSWTYLGDIDELRESIGSCVCIREEFIEEPKVV